MAVAASCTAWTVRVGHGPWDAVLRYVYSWTMGNSVSRTWRRAGCTVGLQSLWTTGDTCCPRMARGRTVTPGDQRGAVARAAARRTMAHDGPQTKGEEECPYRQRSLITGPLAWARYP